MGTPIGFVLGVFVMADQAEDNSKKDVVVTPDTTDTTAESSKLLSQAGNDATYKPPTASTTDNPAQNNAEVQRILEKFSITAQDAGRDATKDLFGGEKIAGSDNFSNTLASRDGKKQPLDRQGRPISNGEISTGFRALVDGARRQNPPLTPEQIKANFDKSLEGTGYRVEIDPKDPERLLLLDSRNEVNGKPREVSRYDLNETPEETGERMANRTLDPTMTVGQQEAFVKQGLTKMLADMPAADRDKFLSEYNRKMEDDGSAQRLEFKDGKATLNPPTDATLPKGLKLENVTAFTDLRNTITNGDLSSADLAAELRKSTEGMDYRQARLFNTEIARELQAKYPESGFTISADSTGQNQKLEVQVSKQPDIRAEVPAGMSLKDAQQWTRSAAELQKISGTPAETLQQRMGDFMRGPEGQTILSTISSLPDGVQRQKYLDGLNASLPNGVKGEYKLGLNDDGKSVNLVREASYNPFNLRLSEQTVDTIRPASVDAARDDIWSRKPEGVTEQNKKAYVDAVTGLQSDKVDVRGNALRTLRDTISSLPQAEQTAMIDGINAELKTAGKDFRISNADGWLEAHPTVVVNGKDVTVPIHLAGDPAKVDAFKQIAQDISDGKTPTELTRAITDLTSKVMIPGREQIFATLNGLLPPEHQNLRFQENGLQVKVGNDAQGQPQWRSVPEGMSLSDASQLGKTIPAGLDGNATRNFQRLVESLSPQNPSEIFNQQRLDQIKSDLSRLDPEQAKIYRDQINAKLGDTFKLNDSGQLVAKTNHGDVPVPNGLNAEQAEKFRSLADLALTPGSKASDIATGLMDALKPPMSADQQRNFLDAFNEQYKKNHNGQYFTQNGSDLNLNQSQFLPAIISSPVLDTFKGDPAKADFDSLLRASDFPNPGTNPKVEAIRDSFSKLRDNPGDATAMKDLLTQLKGANFTPEQIQALQRAFQGGDKGENPPLLIGKDGVIQVGNTTLIRTASGAFMSVTGNMSPEAAQNLKYAAEQIDPHNPISGLTAKNISDILKSVADPTVRNSIVESFNSFLTAVGSKDQVAAHPSGDGINITHTDQGNVETNRWVKETGVEATPQEVATNAVDRLAQNPTDAKALVEQLEAKRNELQQEVERLLDTDQRPYSAEVQAKLKALYDNGNPDTRTTIERSIAVTGDKSLAENVGLTGDALKVVDFSNRIMNGDMDKVGTELSNFLNGLNPNARANVLADLNWAVQSRNGSNASLEFNAKNELVMKKGGTVVDGYPAGEMGALLDVIRDKGIADPYVINNLGSIRDAFAQIKANDPQGLKSFLLQLNEARLPADVQAKLVEGLNAKFNLNVSMKDGILTDGTSTFKLAEVNGEAIAVPGNLSQDLVNKLGSPRELQAAVDAIAVSGDTTQLAALLQAGNGQFRANVERALINTGKPEAGQMARSLGLSDSASFIEVAAKLKAVNIDAAAISNLSDIQSKVAALSTPPTADQMRTLLSALRSSGIELNRQGEILKAIAGDKLSMDGSGILVAGNQRMLEYNGKFVSLPEGFTKVDQLKALMGSLKYRASNEIATQITDLLKGLTPSAQASMVSELQSVVAANGGTLKIDAHPTDGVILTAATGVRIWAHADGKVATPSENIADLLPKLPGDTTARTELLRLAQTNIEAFGTAMKSLVDKASAGDATASAQLASLYNDSNEEARALIEQNLEIASGGDARKVAEALSVPNDVLTATTAHDVQANLEKQVLDTLGSTVSPEIATKIAAEFTKFKTALASGDPSAALTAFASATKGSLNADLVAKLNTQLTGFRLAYGTTTLALARTGGDAENPYFASVSTADVVATSSDSWIAANAEEGLPTREVYNAGEVYQVGQLQKEINPPILEMPKDPALPERVMSQLYGLALETRIELDVALRGKTDPVERARIVQDILVKKGLDIMRHATTSENGMNMAQREAFIKAINNFLVSAAARDNFTADLKDFRFKLSGDATNATVTLEGDGKSIPLTTTESNNRLYEQRLGSDLGIDSTQHKELKDTLRTLRDATTPEAREAAYKAMLSKLESFNLTPDKFEQFVKTLQDPKFRYIAESNTISYDGPPLLNLKRVNAASRDFFLPGDLTKDQLFQMKMVLANFAYGFSPQTNIETLRTVLADAKPELRAAMAKAAEEAFRQNAQRAEIRIENGNLVLRNTGYDNTYAISRDTAAVVPPAETFEVNGKKYEFPPNLTTDQKTALQSVISEIGKPPADGISDAAKTQLQQLLKGLPLGSAREEMLRTINQASAEVKKSFALDGTNLKVTIDGKLQDGAIDVKPEGGPADLAAAITALQEAAQSDDPALLRKAISDFASLYAKANAANFSPQDLATVLGRVTGDKFKFTVDSTTRSGQTDIVVTDQNGKELNRINSRELLGDSTVAAGTAEQPLFKMPDLKDVPEAQRELVANIFRATNIQDMLKAIKEASDKGITQFKIGNDTYRLDVKKLSGSVNLVHLTVNGQIAVKAVDRGGVFHPQSDGKFFGSAYLSKNPTSAIGERAVGMKLSTPQEVSQAIQSGALTLGRPTDGPVSPEQIQTRLKEFGLTIPDTANARTAFNQIQDLQNAIRSSNPVEIRKALDTLKANGNVNPQMEALIAKINESPGNALKIEGDAIKLQIGTQKYDIPPSWDANTIRNLVRLSTTDAKVAANLYRYMMDAQGAVNDKGAILRNLLNSGLDSKQANMLIMEAYKFEKLRNPEYSLERFVGDLKVIPDIGKPEEPVFEYKAGALVASDKAGAVIASISETDAKSAVAAQQLRGMFDASLPGADPKSPSFNRSLIPTAANIAQVLKDLTPVERAKAIEGLKADLQTRGITLDVINPNTTSPRVELTFTDATKQQIKDSAPIGTDAAAAVSPEQLATSFGDAMNQLIAQGITKQSAETLMKLWIDKINAPGVDRAALVNLINQRLGNNGKLEITGTGADTKLKFSRTGMEGGPAEVVLGAPREVAAVASPRTDVPKVEDISGVPVDKAPLVQAIFAAGDMNSMLKAIADAKAANITQFKIGNDVFNLQVINVGNKTSLIHMSVNGKIAVKAVDRNGVYSPQMDGKFFGSSFNHPGLRERMTQWKLGTPQEVAATLRAGTVPRDTTVGATAPIAPLTDQQIKDGLATVGITNIADAANARTAFTQIQDLQNALRSANPTEARRLLAALKANTDVNSKIPELVTKINEATGTNGVLKIDGDTLKMQIGDTKYLIPDNWDANTVRNLSNLAVTDQATAVRIHNYITESLKPGADKALILKTILTDPAGMAVAGNILLEVFKRESALNPGLTLKQFSDTFKGAAPQGWNLNHDGSALVLKDNINIARVTITDSGAKAAVASQALLNLIDTTTPGLNPKEAGFSSARVPKAEVIAAILKGLNPDERALAIKGITDALAAKNIRLTLTGALSSQTVEVSYEPSRGRAIDAKPIGDAAAPPSPEQTALAMGTKLKDMLANPATSATDLNAYLKTIAGQLNAPGLDKNAFLAQIQSRVDAGTPPKTRVELSATGAELVLKREGKPDVAVPVRDVAATTAGGDARPFDQQFAEFKTNLAKTPPPDQAAIDRMLGNLALAHARLTNPPSFDNAAFVAKIKDLPPGYTLVNDTSKTPPEIVLKKGDAVVSTPFKAEQVLAVASVVDKTTASVADLASARGIDASKIPPADSLQYKLFEALLRGKSGRELTLLIKELHGKGLKTFELPDANGKMRKINLEVKGHYVHMYAQDDAGRMRIAIRGTTDGRPQRGGYFGTRWTESMFGKSIIGTNKDATTPTPEVANPAVSATRQPEYKPNPESMKAFTDLMSSTPAADRDKPEFQARIAQAFSDAVRAEIVAKGKGKATEVEAALNAALATKGFNVKFDATTQKFTLAKDGGAALSEVSLANVPEKGQPETVEQRAARFMEPFATMTLEQQKVHLQKFAAEIGALGFVQGKQVFEAFQNQFRRANTTDSRLRGINVRFQNNNEILLDKLGTTTRTERKIDSTDSIPVTFKTTVTPGDLNAFTNRLKEINALSDGKPSTAALDEFKTFLQTVPASNRERTINSALKNALIAHAMLNPDATADQISQSFTNALKSVNSAYGLVNESGNLKIQGLTNPPETIDKEVLAKARLDQVVARQILPFANEIAKAISQGKTDLSPYFGRFANANKDNPALIQGALKLALREQFRLTPDRKLAETLIAFNSVLHSARVPFQIGYDVPTGNVELQQKQGDTVTVLGRIKAREYFTPEKLPEFLSNAGTRFAEALTKAEPGKEQALLDRLHAFMIENNVSPADSARIISELNSKQNKVSVSVRRGKLAFARKAA
jgi:hypothetical protein